MRVQIDKIIIELLHISAKNDDELKQKESILVEAMMYIV